MFMVTKLSNKHTFLKFLYKIYLMNLLIYLGMFNEIQKFGYIRPQDIQMDSKTCHRIIIYKYKFMQLTKIPEQH